MNGLLVTIIFITALVLGVYWYAGYSIRSGIAVDENQNLIPDSWEKNFDWFFKGRNMIILLLGIIIGFALGNILPV